MFVTPPSFPQWVHVTVLWGPLGTPNFFALNSGRFLPFNLLGLPIFPTLIAGFFFPFRALFDSANFAA